MRKSTILFTITVTLILMVGKSVSRAQEKEDKTEKVSKPPVAYHLDFSLNELEDGKKINTRQYSMNALAVQSGPRLPIGYEKDLKIGTRVPVEMDQGKMEYLEIGTSIRCQLFGDETGLISLDARADGTKKTNTCRQAEIRYCGNFKSSRAAPLRSVSR